MKIAENEKGRYSPIPSMSSTQPVLESPPDTLQLFPYTHHNAAMRPTEGSPAQDGAAVSFDQNPPYDWSNIYRGDGACGKTSALNVFTRGCARPYPPQ